MDVTQKPPPTFPPYPRPPTPLSDTSMDSEGRENGYSPGKPYRRTPLPGKRPRDTDQDSSLVDGGKGTRYPPKPDTQKVKLIDGSTQSEEKKTRNIGTMHDPIETRNFGNEVQPQSSSTQTSLSTIKKPSKQPYTFIERPEPMEPMEPEEPLDDDFEVDARISVRPVCPHHDDYEQQYDTISCRYVRQQPSSSRSPKRQEMTDYVYDGQYHLGYDTQYEDQLDYHRIRPDDQYRSPTRAKTRFSPCTILTHEHPPMTSTHRSRTSSPPQGRSRKLSPQYRPHTPAPAHPSIRQPSPPSRRPRSATPRHRPQMHSQETDTSLDAMRKQHHRAVQYEPRSTQEKGTTPTVRIRIPTTQYRSTTFDPSTHNQATYPSHCTMPQEHDHSGKSFYLNAPAHGDYINHDNRYDYYDNEEEEDEYYAPSMHDQSTMAELLIYLDHYTQCESQPFMADRYIQTTPTIDDEPRNAYDYNDESFLRQLPRSGSISIPQSILTQPDTLPRRRQQQPSPPRQKRDGLDYTGNILEVSLHRGQFQRTASFRDSPLLNIGTEHIVDHPNANEYAIPFETRFIYDSDSASNTRSRANGSIVAPVLNSARTHAFNSNPSVHQSRSNGNFFLSSPPPRSSNPSLRVDIMTTEQT